MELKIILHSGISASGFNVVIPGELNKRFDYGYNASYSRKFADKNKPYVSDIIYDLMVKYNIEPENVYVEAGENTFKRSSVSTDKVAEFEEDYLAEVFRKFNN